MKKLVLLFVLAALPAAAFAKDAYAEYYGLGKPE